MIPFIEQLRGYIEVTSGKAKGLPFIIILTRNAAITALLLVLLLTLLDYFFEKQHRQANYQSIAQYLLSSQQMLATEALENQDKTLANLLLQGLVSHEAITAAYLQQNNGSLFSKYIPADIDLASLPSVQQVFQHKLLNHSQPVGQLAIVLDTQLLDRQTQHTIAQLLMENAILISLITLIFIAVLYGTLSHRFRKVMQWFEQDNLLEIERPPESYDITGIQELDQCWHKSLTLAQKLRNTLQQQQTTEQQLTQLNQQLELQVNQRTEQLEMSNRELSNALSNLQSIQKELLESEKMAAMGNMVSGIAHELNTPLGVCVTATSLIIGDLHSVQQSLNENKLTKSDFNDFLQQARESIQVISKNVQRAGELVHSFKQVAVAQNTEQLVKVNISELLKDILMVLTPRLKQWPGITITINGAPDIDIDSYPSALSSIFTNFIINSLIHGFEKQDTGAITLSYHLAEGQFYIEYRDTGRGISEQHLDKIFNAFYTTKRGMGGTGLGLNIVYTHVTQLLKGHIECHSPPDKKGGTQFLINFPVNH